MDIVRQNEIARAVVKVFLREKGISVFSREDFNDDLKKISEETEIPVAELKEFAKIIFAELMKELFS